MSQSFAVKPTHFPNSPPFYGLHHRLKLTHPRVGPSLAKEIGIMSEGISQTKHTKDTKGFQELLEFVRLFLGKCIGWFYPREV